MVDLLTPEALTPSITGHAIEARIYAEDPAQGFLPVTGRVHGFSFPQQFEVRVDSGVEAGSVVSIHYDPMLAKVIAHAATREEAATTLALALRHARIHGPVTNRELLVRVLEHEDFRAGSTDTHFLETHDMEDLSAPLVGDTEADLAAVAAAVADRLHRKQEAPVLGSIEPGWRNSPSQPQTVDYRWRDTTIEVGYDGVAVVDQSPSAVTFDVNGDHLTFAVDRVGSARYVDGPSGPVVLEALPRFAVTDIEEDPGSLHAPMPGRVLRVDVAVGDQVEVGQTLMVLEAMKMEHTLRAPLPGTVTAVGATAGQQVDADAVLVVVEAG